MKTILKMMMITAVVASTSFASEKEAPVSMMGQKAAGALNKGGAKVAQGVGQGNEAMNNALKAGNAKLTDAVNAMGDIENAVKNNVALTQQQAQQLGTVCKAVTADVLVVGADVKQNVSNLCSKGKRVKGKLHSLKEKLKK